MSGFRHRRIRQKPPFKPMKKLKALLLWLWSKAKRTTKKQRSYAAAGVVIIFGVFIIYQVLFAAYTAIRNFNPQELVFALGSELKKDENGYTNIIVLGDGGHVRDGADLIDTIMVASIDYEKQAVSLFSIPRDYYVGNDFDASRINELYRNYHKQIGEAGAFNKFKEAAGQIVDLDIQYFVRLDFNAFVAIIDAVDGIEVDVTEAIDDPYYPNETDDGYTTFRISKGLQTLDGETALKYARSRKTTSDFDRARRQQQILQAINAKASDSSTIRSPKTIKKVYEAVEENINTDIELREMIALAGFAKHLDTSHIIQKQINDDPGVEGGFLYTPERKYYDGQFVLVPFGNNFDLIHSFAHLIFHNRDMYINKARIGVYNATKEPGIARNTAYFLNRFGFDIVDIDNEFDAKGEKRYYKESFIRYNTWNEDEETGVITPVHGSTLEGLTHFIKGESVPGDEFRTPKADIEIVLGDDYEVFAE